MRYLVLTLVLWQFMVMTPAVGDDSLVVQGEYLVRAAGCVSCHTDHDNSGDYLAGGRVLATPFGKFYAPNITSDTQHGVGAWSDEDFINALQQGVSPSGDHYYPAFPYTSYSKMSDQELRDLKAYLDSRPAVNQANRPHELGFPFDQRPLLALWKWLFFESESFKPDPARSASWNRGAYIVNGPGHCVECHTPRNLLGAIDSERLLAGNPAGPEGEEAPAINGPSSASFRYWSITDTVFGLETGITPEGDALGGSMAHVIKNTTSQLSAADLRAIADYLASPQ